VLIIPHLNLITKDRIPQTINQILRVEKYQLKPKAVDREQLATKEETLYLTKRKD